jgi:hypothetical protein
MAPLPQVLTSEPRALHMAGKSSTTEPHPLVTFKVLHSGWAQSQICGLWQKDCLSLAVQGQPGKCSIAHLLMKYI